MKAGSGLSLGAAHAMLAIIPTAASTTSRGLRECFLVSHYSYRFLSLYLSLNEQRENVFFVYQALAFFSLRVQSTNASSNVLIFSDVLVSFRLPCSSNFSAALAIMTSGWFNGNMFKKTNI